MANPRLVHADAVARGSKTRLTTVRRIGFVEIRQIVKRVEGRVRHPFEFALHDGSAFDKQLPNDGTSQEQVHDYRCDPDKIPLRKIIMLAFPVGLS